MPKNSGMDVPVVILPVGRNAGSGWSGKRISLGFMIFAPFIFLDERYQRILETRLLNCLGFDLCSYSISKVSKLISFQGVSPYSSNQLA